MGDKLIEIYNVVTEKAGFEGRMELAKKTGISRKKAETEEDTAEKITQFKDAATQIVGESIDPFLRRW